MEAKQVIENLQRTVFAGENGLQVYQMCEIPNNVVQIDAFSDYFDGFSIGSNDLTQLTLGIDRDSAVIGAFDERDRRQKMVAMAVEDADGTSGTAASAARRRAPTRSSPISMSRGSTRYRSSPRDPEDHPPCGRCREAAR